MESSVDVARIAEAISRPGIDPRSFVSLAIVTKVSVEDVGVICDVTILPSGVPESATLSPLYGGAGFGLYTPIEVDQMVVVVAPEGDPGHGLRIVSAVWDQGEPPPGDVQDHPTDVLLIVKKDRSCRIVVDGGGDLVLAARGSGVVKLGDDTAGDAPLNADDVVVQGALADFMAAMATAISSSGDTGPGSLAALQTALQALSPTGWSAKTTKTKAK